ncbi:LysR family transcriptional regulator [Cellulomonas pakistanensis]|uniref:LysR family transcriptional regulator n=1 Tax=Cellulomonas pakistanensis TaxID=992287 RepID=UPI0019437632|nr:LysR family transcriptional regulator [Cellulomonas pakistanensis]
MHLSITHLATFLAVVQHGSMTTAAIALTYSLSTVSAHVTHLERQLRTRLLRRTANGCEPTAAGQQVAEKAAELLEVHRDIVAGASDTRSRPVDASIA